MQKGYFRLRSKWQATIALIFLREISNARIFRVVASPHLRREDEEVAVVVAEELGRYDLAVEV